MSLDFHQNTALSENHQAPDWLLTHESELNHNWHWSPLRKILTLLYALGSPIAKINNSIHKSEIDVFLSTTYVHETVLDHESTMPIGQDKCNTYLIGWYVSQDQREPFV